MKKLILSFSLILLFASFSYCEEIFMRNGDHFSGNLSLVMSEIITIETEYGKMNIPKDKILKIIFNRSKKNDLNKIDELRIEDILNFIKSSSKKFYLDGKKINGGTLSNSVRLKKMMSAPNLKDIKIFVQKFLTRSEKGKLIKVRVDGKKINIVDWLDSKIANLELKIVVNKKKKIEKINFKRVRKN